MRNTYATLDAQKAQLLIRWKHPPKNTHENKIQGNTRNIGQPKSINEKAYPAKRKYFAAGNFRNFQQQEKILEI